MRKTKLSTSLAAMGLAAVLMFTGCGNSAANNESSSVAESNSGEELGSEDENTSGSAEETSEETAEAPTVVATSVAVVSILDELGVPMAGVPTSSYELPESVADAVRIGNPMSPDIEVVTSLEPDIIVSVDSLSEELKEQFDLTGAESIFANLSSYDGLKSSVEELGAKFGKEDKAEAILADFEEREAKIAESIEGKESPSVLIIFGVSGSFMVASEDSYVGDLVKRTGGVNVITDAPAAFSPVDMEYLASQNPDYILFMAHANPEESLQAFEEEFATNEAWQNFDAVKNGNVVALDTGYFGMSANLQAIDAMESLIDILYGEN